MRWPAAHSKSALREACQDGKERNVNRLAGRPRVMG